MPQLQTIQKAEFPASAREDNLFYFCDGKVFFEGAGESETRELGDQQEFWWVPYGYVASMMDTLDEISYNSQKNSVLAIFPTGSYAPAKLQYTRLRESSSASFLCFEGGCLMKEEIWMPFPGTETGGSLVYFFRSVSSKWNEEAGNWMTKFKISRLDIVRINRMGDYSWRTGNNERSYTSGSRLTKEVLVQEILNQKISLREGTIDHVLDILQQFSKFGEKAKVIDLQFGANNSSDILHL